MARMDNLHSRVVAWLKVLLPLAALTILSSLFLISNRINPEDAIPYATVDVEERLREPRMTAPTFSGTTTDGASVILTAERAVPDQGAGAAALAPLLQVTTPDGAQSRISAGAAQLAPDNDRLSLTGGVTIENSSGYTLETDSLTGLMDRTHLESAGAISGAGPLGQVSAGKLELRQAADSPGDYVLVFSGGVKLVYLPPAE